MNGGEELSNAMPNHDFNDLLAFLAVARERSFTKAAAKLGIVQSTLSHTIKRLESQMGLRLVARTTRSVALTEAGERLRQSLASRIEDIEHDIAALMALRDKPSGSSGSRCRTTPCKAWSGPS
jgi:DNA-binding transcriptional LysR family regulator